MMMVFWNHTQIKTSLEFRSNKHYLLLRLFALFLWFQNHCGIMNAKSSIRIHHTKTRARGNSKQLIAAVSSTLVVVLLNSAVGLLWHIFIPLFVRGHKKFGGLYRTHQSVQCCWFYIRNPNPKYENGF